MPNRILKESIRTSDTIGELSWFEEVLFYRLIVSCDDYGRFDGRTAIIKGTCFPLKDVTNKNIEDALKKLVSVGLVRHYEVAGKPYLQLSTWQSHQNIRAKKSKYPNPDEGKDITFANNCKHMNADVPVIQSESNPNPNTESIERVVCAWNELEKYGIKPIKKMDKTSKRYKNLNARIEENSVEEVLEAIENVKNSPFLQGKTDKGDWKITFDWLVLPNNFTKVLEGQYEGEVKRKGFSNFAERDYDMSQMERALLGIPGGGNHAD